MGGSCCALRWRESRGRRRRGRGEHSCDLAPLGPDQRPRPRLRWEPLQPLPWPELRMLGAVAELVNSSRPYRPPQGAQLESPSARALRCHL